MHSRQRTVAAVGMVLWLVLAGGSVYGAAAARPVWELTPYRVQVYVSVAPGTELAPSMSADMASDLRERIDALQGAAWDATIAPAPPALARAMAAALEDVKIDDLPKESLKGDKVLLLLISTNGEGYRVAVRELDVRTQIWGTEVVRSVRQAAKLRDAAFGALTAAFAPLAQIETIKRDEVILRLRAGALAPRDPALAAVKPGSAFRPVVRANDRDGKARRIAAVPWTFLTVEEVVAEGLRCRIESGMRSPLSGRRSARSETLALGVVPSQESSTIVLESRGQVRQRLGGYSVYEQSPGAKEPKLLGQTDREGRVVVPPAADQRAVRFLLVKNGGEVLARLPVVPGLEPQVVAPIANDDQRLEAESVVTGLQEELIDMMARRTVLISRTKTHLQARRFDQAQQLIDELRQLPTGGQYLRNLAEQQRELLSVDPVVQRKIDALFAQTQKMLAAQPDANAVEELQDQLRKAKAGGGAQGSGTQGIPGGQGPG